MRPPAFHTNSPSSQPITRITAITYNRFPILFYDLRLKNNVRDISLTVNQQILGIPVFNPHALRMIPRIIAITAITNRIWIKPPDT